MAYDYSHVYLKRLKFPHYPIMHVRLFLHPVIRRWRMCVRRVLSLLRVQRAPLPLYNIITAHFDATQQHFSEQGWSWTTNFFEDGFWQDLKKHFPPRIFLNPPRIVIKSYDVGFSWRRKHPSPRDIALFPEVDLLFRFLQSPKWLSRIQTYLGTTKEMALTSFLINITRPGSCVIPHKDDPLPGNAQPFVNMIFFIDGTGGG